MLANGCVKAEDFHDFLHGLREDNASQLTEERIFEAVSNINKKLTRYNMMIRSSLDEKSLERFYVLISTVDNATTRQASHHTPKEFEYFRQVWQTLTQGDASLRSIKKMGQDNKLTNSKQLLEEWHSKRWIVIDEDMVRLGPRSKAELDVLS